MRAFLYMLLRQQFAVALSKYDCIGWKQTGACSASGPPDPAQDKDCMVEVPKGASGFCVCGGGRKVSLVGCDHEPFTCKTKCVDKNSKIKKKLADTGSACAMWRQTGSCDSTGRYREPKEDKPCQSQIADGNSGYCECQDGRKAMLGNIQTLVQNS